MVRSPVSPSIIILLIYTSRQTNTTVTLFKKKNLFVSWLHINNLVRQPGKSLADTRNSNLWQDMTWQHLYVCVANFDLCKCLFGGDWRASIYYTSILMSFSNSASRKSRVTGSWNLGFCGKNNISLRERHSFRLTKDSLIDHTDRISVIKTKENFDLTIDFWLAELEIIYYEFCNIKFTQTYQLI